MITWQRQPSKFSCGQACVAMLTGEPVADVIATITDVRGTVAQQLALYLRSRGWYAAPRAKGWLLVWHHCGDWHKLPPVALCRVRWGSDPKDRRAHWVLWSHGQFWDPLTPGSALFLKSPHGRILSYLEIRAPKALLKAGT